VAVSKPAWLKALLMMPIFIIYSGGVPKDVFLWGEQSVYRGAQGGGLDESGGLQVVSSAAGCSVIGFQDN
jgi:hypothetical protein